MGSRKATGEIRVRPPRWSTWGAEPRFLKTAVAERRQDIIVVAEDFLEGRDDSSVFKETSQEKPLIPNLAHWA